MLDFALMKSGFSLREIAKEVGVHHSSVGSELNRNTGSRGYRYNQAQRTAERRRGSESKAPWKMTPELWQEVESLLKDGWSSARISGRFRRFGRVMARRQWIYEYLRTDRKRGGVLCKYLRR